MSSISFLLGSFVSPDFEGGNPSIDVLSPFLWHFLVIWRGKFTIPVFVSLKRRGLILAFSLARAGPPTHRPHEIIFKLAFFLFL